jgi:hypothetical protein
MPRIKLEAAGVGSFSDMIYFQLIFAYFTRMRLILVCFGKQSGSLKQISL